MAGVVEQQTNTLYEVDEHAWIECRIAALRDGALDRLDRVNLIAYLTDMAARDRRELGSAVDCPVRPHFEVADTTRKSEGKLAADDSSTATGDPATAEKSFEPQPQSRRNSARRLSGRR
jgi:hypothetical protein